MPPYKPIPDPFPGKGPLPPNAPDFYERDELFTNIQNLLRAGESISLVGERKAGKTSFLNHLLTHLPADEFIPVLIDAQGVAPKGDKMFLGRLARDASRAIAQAAGLAKIIKTATLTAQPDEIYLTFQDDLEELRGKLPVNSNGQKRRLIWLIDEIETLRGQGYEKTELFSFLRPIAQSDLDFRFVVAGYDVLYILSSQSEWSPFFNAFRHVKLERFKPTVAQLLINDALTKMGVTIESDLPGTIFGWTGQKPYFLKWILSKVAETLNQEQSEPHLTSKVLQTAQNSFLSEKDLSLHFTYLWNTHLSHSQQTVLSLLASQDGPYYHPKILNDLKEQELLEGDQKAAEHLKDDLDRLNDLSFLYKQDKQDEHGSYYTFTSGCLQTWIRKNKPLG